MSIEDLLLEYSLKSTNQSIKTIIAEILDLKHRQEIITKRDLFYKYKPLLKTMSRTDSILTEISKQTGLERIDLNIVATQKGLVYGDLIIITKDDKQLDASQSPILIPNRQNIKHLHTLVTKFLIIEKDAVFHALVDKGFNIQFPDCLLITGKGYPDIVTRELVVALSELSIPIQTLYHGSESLVPDLDQADKDDFWSDNTSNASFFSNSHNHDHDDDNDTSPYWSNPVLTLSLSSSNSKTVQGYILTDCDPHGYEIYKIYKSGSDSLRHLDRILSCPNLLWVGIKPSMVDADLWNLKLTTRERNKLVKMIKKSQERGEKLEGKEMERMLHNGYKCEIEVFGAQMLMDSIVV